MASSTFFLFLIISITISSPLILQIQARDSQFFSKVTTKPTETTTETTVVLPDKAKEQHSLVEETGPTQQPEFVPNENGYGLYGHETGLNSPEAEKYYNNDKNAAFTSEQYGNGEKETFYSNNGEKYDTSADVETKSEKDDLLNFDDVFDNSKYGKEETFYTNNNNGVGTEQYSTDSQNDNNNGEEKETYYNTDRNGQFGNQLGERETDTETYYNDNRFDDNRFTDELNSRYKAYRGEPNAVRKGMSDTRFVENGKYFYDVDKEQEMKNYDSKQNTYKTQYDDVGSRAYESNEVVGDSKYDGASYDNSGAEKYEFDTMEEYEKSRLNNQYDP